MTKECEKLPERTEQVFHYLVEKTVILMQAYKAGHPVSGSTIMSTNKRARYR